jgi:hypothetical protein
MFIRLGNDICENEVWIWKIGGEGKGFQGGGLERCAWVRFVNF